MHSVQEVVFREVKDALHRATTRAIQGEIDDTEAHNPPLLMVKNTFLEVRDPLAEALGPTSLSCPIDAFSCGGVNDYDDIETFVGTLTGSSDIGLSELSAAARVFSTGEISREAMEAAGHVVTRRPSEPALLASTLHEPLCNTRPLPPPILCEPELPEAPQWSPKVPSVTGMMHARPVPPMLQMPSPSPLTRPMANAMTAVPIAQTPPQPPPAAHNVHQCVTPMRSESLYRVAYRGGVALRQCPYFDGARTGIMLHHNEIFSVSEEIQGSDGRLYLRLTDGRGWAFDDSALIPQDPSVVRGSWAPLSSTATPSTHATTPASSVWEPMEEPMTPLAVAGAEEETKKKRRRRKRGGVKRRPKNKLVSEGSLAELDTDAPPSEIEMVGSEGPHSEMDGSSADARSEVEVHATTTAQ